MFFFPISDKNFFVTILRLYFGYTLTKVNNKISLQTYNYSLHIDIYKAFLLYVCDSVFESFLYYQSHNCIHSKCT